VHPTQASSTGGGNTGHFDAGVVDGGALDGGFDGGTDGGGLDAGDDGGVPDAGSDAGTLDGGDVDGGDVDGGDVDGGDVDGGDVDGGSTPLLPPQTCIAGAAGPLGPIPVDVVAVERPQELPLGIAIPTLVARENALGWLIAERHGRIFAVDALDASGVATLYADLSDRVATGNSWEAGLVGVVGARADDVMGHAYVFYTAASPTAMSGLSFRLSRFVEENGALIAESEEILIERDKRVAYHHAGTLVYGPDGHLYVSVGDNWQNTPGSFLNNPYAQDPFTVEGSLLRLDVREAPGYAIPIDNPFADGVNGAPEVYAFGLRNPWKHSFDRKTGAHYVADVGRAGFEEVNLVAPGGNYGWPVFEGSYCHVGASCDTLDAITPLSDFPRAELTCAIGGFVYRGSEIPELVGHYVVGDCVYGTIWAIDLAEPSKLILLAMTSSSITSFAEDESGELFFADFAGGMHRLVRLVDTGGQTPTLLSETGCVDATTPISPAASTLRDEVNFPFWSDGLDKERFVALPDGATIDEYRRKSAGDPTLVVPQLYDFPDGTVFVKHFTEGELRVETRLFMRHEGGQWRGYSYEWNDDQTDATLLTDGKEKTLPSGRMWTFPSPSQCIACHTYAGGRALGFHPSQLNRDVVVDGAAVNQIAHFRALGLVSTNTAVTFSTIAKKDDPATLLEPWMRGYLHANCAMCHQPDGASGHANWDGRFTVLMSAAGKRLIDRVPLVDDFDIEDARLIAPGDPTRSILLNRIIRKDEHRMPYVGNLELDSESIERVTTYIEGL
jgi:glucose/arabinose dehydrogenase